MKFLNARLLLLFGAVFGIWSSASAQTTCTPAGSSPTVRAEGLTERIGDISIICVGGTGGAVVNLTFFVTLNVNVTNRTDVNNNITGVTVTVNTGAGAVPAGSQQLFSGTSFGVQNLNYTVPTLAGTPVTIIVSGIRAAAAMLPAGVRTINATVTGVGAQFPPTNSVAVGLASTGLLTSVINNGVPCSGSPGPPTLDFSGFSSVSAISSTIRLTEGSPAAFTVKDGTTDAGARIVVKMTGYSAGARVFVPDVVVGSNGTAPTSTGAFGATVGAGTFTPGLNQLLLIRIGGAGVDANGNGGFFTYPLPNVQTSTSTFTEIPLVSGAGTAVYEVASSNPNLLEIAQVPIFLYAPSIACGANPVVLPTITAALAPVSTVTTGTQLDPIPRFSSATPLSDCQQNGDCAAAYFPRFSADITPVNISGPSLGNRQGSNIAISNAGGGVVSYSVAISYQAGSGSWLTVTPATGELTSGGSLSLQVFADPSTLQPGIYNATVTISGGVNGSNNTFVVPVTFTVGPPGVTVTAVINAASGTVPVAPGSYGSVYGTNFGGQNVSVTFNGFNAQVIFSNTTLINVIVPPALGSAPAADVVVKVDGKISNSYKAALALNAPGLFNPGIENADGSVNTSINLAANGSFVAVYFTGLAIPLTGQVTVNIGNQMNLIPLYAGAQPTLSALDQVNVTIPTALAGTANPVPISICIPGPSGQPVCSNAVNLYIK